MSPVALVTGAARGIGRAIAVQLAADGMCVMLTDRDEAALAATCEDLARTGAEVAWVSGDLACARDVEGLVPAVLKRWGRLDALICNATYHGERRPVLETSAEDWTKVFAVNVLAAATLALAAARDMATRGTGNVVMIGSVQAALPAPHYAAYVASKAAVEGLTRALAVELAGFGIRTNCVAPGVIVTENYSKNLESLAAGGAATLLASLSGQAGTPEDVAAAVAFLCSDDARFVTGATLPVDGGRAISRRSDPFQTVQAASKSETMKHG